MASVGGGCSSSRGVVDFRPISNFLRTTVCFVGLIEAQCLNASLESRR
jgi:hypothetical protein